MHVQYTYILTLMEFYYFRGMVHALSFGKTC